MLMPMLTVSPENSSLLLRFGECQNHWVKPSTNPSEDNYENVVTYGYRILPQDTHVDGQELIIKAIINKYGKRYFKDGK